MALLQRTRDFIPDEEAEQEPVDIYARLNELKKNYESFDFKKHFVGLKRLGDSYTVAEPYAYFDGPNECAIRFGEQILALGSGIAGYTASMLIHKGLHVSQRVSLIRSLAVAALGAFAGYKMYHVKEQIALDKRNLFFHYALLHEKDFPPISKFVAHSKSISNKLSFHRERKDWRPASAIPMQPFVESNWK